MNPAGLIRSFVRHRVAANILMLLMLAVGLVAAGRLNTQLEPDVSFQVINVGIVWPGASADDIDRSIVEPVYPEVRYLPNVEEVTARSREGVGEFWIEYAQGTDMTQALSQVESAIAAITTLPQGAEDPVITRAENWDPVMDIVISGPMSEMALRAFARQMRDDLLNRGADRVSVQGLRDAEIWVEVPASELNRLDLTLSDVAARVAASSRDVPSGSLTGGIEKQVRAIGQQETAEQMAGLTLRVDEEGRRLTLGDIATVSESFEDGVVGGRRGGYTALQLGVFRAKDGGDILAMTNSVNRYIDQVRQTLPPTLKVEVYNRISDYLGDRIRLLLTNGLGGMILVVATLWLFLRPRMTFWVAMGIPVSLAATFALMLAMGQSINMISLFALIMVLGIIVDDAIVVAERAQSLYEKGYSAEQAAELGARQMFWPVTAASLTTIAAFGPMLLIGGEAGDFISAIPMVAIAVIVASLVECFLILPSHLKGALSKDSGRSSRFRLWFERSFNGFRDGRFHRFVALAAHYRYATIASALAVLLLSIGLMAGGRVPFTFLPSPESQWMTLNVMFSPGTPRSIVAQQLDEAEDALYRVEKQLGYEPGKLVTMAWGQIGETRSQEIAPQLGDFIGAMEVELIPADMRDDRIGDILKKWEAEVDLLPGIDQVVFAEQRVGFSGSGIGWRLTHEDPLVLKQASLELQEVMTSYAGVSGTRDNLPFGKDELVITVTPKGEALGFTTEIVGRQLRDALDGAIAKRFARGNEEVTVRVRLPDADQSEQALRDLKLRAPSGAEVPLSEVVTLDERPGIARIIRQRGQRVASISANVDHQVAKADEIRKSIEENHLPRILEKYGVEKMAGDQAENEAEFFADFFANIGLALVAIYLILAWIMGSWSQPISVMAIIPFGVAGAILGHLALGYNMTMLSYIAIMGLSGILVNDAILLVDTVKDKLREGDDLPTAVVNASRDRLRPVLLTSLTTIGGLLPLLFETNLQAQMLIPMAISLVFGLATATALVLVLVPALLLMLDDLRRIFVRWFRWFTVDPDAPKPVPGGD